MGINFPTAPAIGTIHPNPAISGVPQYTWDGEKWVSGTGGGAIYISDTAPAAPVGSLWWESDTGILYVRYYDGSSTQWVAIAGGDISVTKGYVDSADALRVLKAGDTMTGSLIGRNFQAGSLDLIPGVPSRVQASHPTDNSFFAVGQGPGSHLEFGWGYNVTPALAQAMIATFGYANPILIDGSVLYLNALSGGVVNAPNVAAADSSTKVATTKFVTDAVTVARLGRNVVINGGFPICQRNAAAGTLTVDNNYWADRWRYLGEASGTTYGNESVGSLADANGNLSTAKSAAIQFPGANSKGGAFQVIEGINCHHMRGRTVVFSTLIAVSDVRLGNMKMGILEWTGAVDAVAGDPVSAWNADGVTPTLAANWAFKNVPANLGATVNSALYQVSATLSNVFTNLAVMIWNDDKVFNASDYFRFGNVQLEIGSVATPFEALPVSQVLAQCQRYFRMSYDVSQGFKPGSITGAGSVGYQAFGTGGEAAPAVLYGVPMRVPPSIGIYSPTTGAGGARRNYSSGVDEAMTGFNMSSCVSHYGSGTGHAVNSIYAYHYVLASEL